MKEDIEFWGKGFLSIVGIIAGTVAFGLVGSVCVHAIDFVLTPVWYLLSCPCISVPFLGFVLYGFVKSCQGSGDNITTYPGERAD